MRLTFKLIGPYSIVSIQCFYREKSFCKNIKIRQTYIFAVYSKGVKRFDFLFLSSKFAKPENSATVPSTAAMRLEIWHMFNMLVRTHQTLL